MQSPVRAVRVTAWLACGLALCLAAGARADESRASAEKWKKQANDTRAQVVAVAGELEKIGADDNEDASGLIADAVRWLGKGDGELASADGKMAEGDFASASSTYNMAWQYYVKAATAGLNARRILTGE